MNFDDFSKGCPKKYMPTVVCKYYGGTCEEENCLAYHTYMKTLKGVIFIVAAACVILLISL